ncbi:MAG: sugar phosphate isomerase/epimerase [Clostridia bacterium]|nr:sugar phosphate isomerase/epimerase [Clostridia bacterium]
MIIGAQLFTVRDYCKTPEDLKQSLKKCADMGYRAVQLSGICEVDASLLRSWLDEYSLEAPITHTAFGKIADDTDKVIADHKILGARYVGLGSVPDFRKSGCDKAVFDAALEKLAPAIEKIHAAGLKFMYHNHNMEFCRFDGGQLCLDYLTSLFPAEKLGVTLDCYWVTAGGGDPVFWLDKLAGRTDCIHLKDMVYYGPESAVRMAPIGEGNLNHPAILEACERTGVGYAFVEQDHCYGRDPFECLEASLYNLRAMGAKD